MTLRINKEAGKGDRRRATQNDEAYRSNYDLIFGKKVKPIPDLPETVIAGITQYEEERNEEDKKDETTDQN